MSWLKRRLPTKKWKRICLYLASFLMILLAADVLLTQYWRRIEIGHDTTRITGPLTPEGIPDYIAALNALAAEGVTRENNAAPLLLEIWGTASIREEWRAKMFPKIGMPVEPSLSIFKGYEAWSKEHPLATTSAAEPNRVPDLAPPTAPETPSKTSDELQEMMHRPWKADAHPRWSQWLSAQRAAFDKAHVALQRPRYYVPYHSGYGERLVACLLPALSTYRDLGNAMVAEAMRSLGEGDFESFARNIEDVRKMARLLGAQQSLIEKLVGIALETLATQAVQRVAATPDTLSSTQARRMLVLLNTAPALPPFKHSVDLLERWMLLDWLCAASKHGFFPISMGKPQGSMWAQKTFVPLNYNLMLRDANDLYDQVLAAYSEPTYRQRCAAVKRVEDDMSRRAQEALADKLSHPSKAISTAIIATTAPAFINVFQHEETARMDVNLASVALALRIYRLEHNAFPESLEALAPGIVRQIPRDTFADTPLKYRKEGAGYVLYSVGRDEVDDSGAERSAGRKTWDMVVRAKE